MQWNWTFYQFSLKKLLQLLFVLDFFSFCQLSAKQWLIWSVLFPSVAVLSKSVCESECGACACCCCLKLRLDSRLHHRTAEDSVVLSFLSIYTARCSMCIARYWDYMVSVSPAVCNVGRLGRHSLKILENDCTWIMDLCCFWRQYASDRLHTLGFAGSKW